MSLKAPKYVDTVRRFIYWQYAQLIAKAAPCSRRSLSA